MAKATQTKTVTKKTTVAVTIKPKTTSTTSKTNGAKRCPTCGKFMK